MPDRRRFDQARPFLVLGVVLAAWLVVPMVVKRFARISFYEMQAPVDATTSIIRDLQDFWALKTRSKNELIQAGRDQARLNASHEITLQQNAALLAAQARLEALLRLPSWPSWRTEPARVVRRDFNAFWQRMVIRKGANYGITVGAPVIYSGGVAGRVTEVHAYTSVVELLSSPGVRIAAVFEGDTHPVSYQGGTHLPLAPPGGVLEFVPLDIFATPANPRRLLTAGIGGVFPPGLVIGEVTTVEPGTDGLFKTGRVTLDPRLARLDEVAVLVPLAGKPEGLKN
ncbi:cell shape-determining protein [Opitutaceae bacterium TAV1]|nr:cell shape-determining protein [Opitutaceae bacterium TAV1]